MASFDSMLRRLDENQTRHDEHQRSFEEHRMLPRLDENQTRHDEHQRSFEEHQRSLEELKDMMRTLLVMETGSSTWWPSTNQTMSESQHEKQTSASAPSLLGVEFNLEANSELQDRRNDKEIVVDALKVEDFVDELEKADFGQIVKEHQNCVVSLQESTAQQIEEEPENVPKSTEHILGTLAILLRDCSHVPPPKLFGDGGHDNLHQLGFLHEKQFPAPTPLKVLPISSLEIMECQNYFEEMSKTELDEKVAISIDKIELNLVKPEMNPVESLDFGGAHKVLDIMPTTNIVLLGSCFHLMKSNAHELFEKMPEKNLIDADETVTLLNALGDFYASIDSCSSFVFDPGKGFAFPLHIESAIDDFIKVLNTLGDAFGSVQSRSFPFDPGKHFELSSHTTSCAVCCGFFIKIVLQTGAG